MKTSFETINPTTGKPLATYTLTPANEVSKILSDAVKAQKAWAQRPVSERCEVLRRIADVLEAKIPECAREAALEMGKPVTQGRTEVEKCVRTFRWYADNAQDFLQPQRVQTEARKSYVSYQPLGVVLAVMPWNYPFWQVFRALAPILAGGNVMVLKHAANVSGCAQIIGSLFKENNELRNLLQVVFLSGPDAGELIARPEIAAVTFTGSTAVGRKIASAAGHALKPHVLELGGSDPYVILQDADIDAAVKLCAETRMGNCGQSCISPKRFIVVKDCYEAFSGKMAAALEEISFTDPLGEGSAMGPMAREDLRDELHEQVQKSIAAGAKLVLGGEIPQKSGAWYPPTLLTDVKPGMPAFDEELFGPVAAVIPAEDEADAFRLANDTNYGLGGAVFSQDRDRAERLAREVLEAGSCFVNAAVHSDPRLPFGGIKESGYGRELGGNGIHEFVNIKTIYVQ